MHLLGSLAMSVFLATSALAQGIVVGAPSAGANVPLASDLTVQIEQHNSLSSFKDLSVAIGYTVCDPTEGCEGSAQVLYNGPFTPTVHTPPGPGGISAYQNFTFASPFTAPGPAQLTIVHFYDVGVSNIPLLQTVNVNFNVV